MIDEYAPMRKMQKAKNTSEISGRKLSSGEKPTDDRGKIFAQFRKETKKNNEKQ